MKSSHALGSPDHPSYQRHKQQMWTQILLPIIVAVLVFAAVTFLMARAAFQGGGDSGRWAAISTIWLVLPVMVGGLIILALVGAVIFLLASFTGVIPTYSYRIQRFFYRIEYGTKRGATMVHRPILLAQGLLSVVRSAISTAWERIR